jgi:enoyl-CoA hydratase/carnithine racemase
VTETLTINRPRPGSVVLQLNRPKQLNAINEIMRDELTLIFATIGADTSVNVVVLTGAGRGFCSGIDVRNFGTKTPEASDPAIDRLRFQEAMAALPQLITQTAFMLCTGDPTVLTGRIAQTQTFLREVGRLS